jgi:hypothetical protein
MGLENVSFYQRIGLLPVRFYSLFKIWIWKSRRESFFAHAIYLCVPTDDEYFHYSHLTVSQIDLRLLEISEKCFSPPLLYSLTWSRAFRRSLISTRSRQLAISSLTRFLTMLDHISCAHTPLTATELDRKSTAFQSPDLRQTTLSL